MLSVNAIAVVSMHLHQQCRGGTESHTQASSSSSSTGREGHGKRPHRTGGPAVQQDNKDNALCLTENCINHANLATAATHSPASLLSETLLVQDPN
jgi:hypothetical protein